MIETNEHSFHGRSVVSRLDDFWKAAQDPPSPHDGTAPGFVKQLGGSLCQAIGWLFSWQQLWALSEFRSHAFQLHLRLQELAIARHKEGRQEDGKWTYFCSGMLYSLATLCVAFESEVKAAWDVQRERAEYPIHTHRVLKLLGVGGSRTAEELCAELPGASRWSVMRTLMFLLYHGLVTPESHAWDTWDWSGRLVLLDKGRQLLTEETRPLPHAQESKRVAAMHSSPSTESMDDESDESRRRGAELRETLDRPELRCAEVC